MTPPKETPPTAATGEGAQHNTGTRNLRPSHAFAQAAPVLVKNGYRPIPINGKRPATAGWTAFEVTDTALRTYARHGIGILTGCNGVYAIDVDCPDKRVAQAVAEYLARRLHGRGELPIRFGSHPKFAVLVRCDHPLRKNSTNAFVSPQAHGENGDPLTYRVEILGQGQQIATFSIHPATGEPYSWYGGSPLDIPVDALPLVPKDEFAEILSDLERIFRQHGLVQCGSNGVRRVNGSSINATFKVKDTPPPETPDEVARVRRMLASFPPAYLDDRNNWYQLGAALHWTRWDGGYELWTEASRKSSKFDEEDQRKTWAGFREDRDNPITLATIFHSARDANDGERVKSVREAGTNRAERPTAIATTAEAAAGRLLAPDGLETDPDRILAAHRNVADLAQLPTVEYALRREHEAKALGMPVALLDKAVKESRRTGDGTPQAGQELVFDESEPFGEIVDGAELLDELSGIFGRFAVLPPHAANALALWVVFTYVLDAARTAPILALLSPEPRCGKSTVLALLSRLVRRPLPASNITAAALFRCVEKARPTLLIDEGDTFLRENEELRGVLNSGHTRDTAFVIRTVGDAFEPRRFSTWGAKTIALIGKLPSTLHDRSIAIHMRRKVRSERVDSLRSASPALFERVCSRLVRFAKDNVEALRQSRPVAPESLNDRAADNWAPLQAIADLAGGGWPGRARKAALALSDDATNDRTIGTELLEDIQKAFQKCGRISTSDLIAVLCADDERPWSTFDRGKWMTPRQLAKRLREFGIRSKNLRDDGRTLKGYERDDFAETFTRYLVREANVAATALQPLENRANACFPL